jgi:ferrochelatase
MERTGVLLVNLGTPKAPSVKAVRQYLKEFLSDPLVIDLPWLLRQVLLRCVILPFRPKQSAHAYQQIWTDEGSPLLVHSQQFKEALQDQLGDDYTVVLAMRYGEPDIKAAIKRLYKRGCHRVIFFPLFPQYSSAATGSAILAVQRAFQSFADYFTLNICTSFYDEPAFYETVAALGRESIEKFSPDFVLFSYHGLPERQLTKSGCEEGRCDRQRSCLIQQPDLEHCYRAQCFKTTELIANALGLDKQIYDTSFQSRLGKTVWVQPYTDEILNQLKAKGVKRLLVFSPSFVVDCLETLEELAMRLREQWMSMGGDDLQLVPALNADPRWVTAFADMVKAAANFAHD